MKAEKCGHVFTFTFMNHDGRNYLVPTSWQGKDERTVMHGEGAKVKVLWSYIVMCSGLAKEDHWGCLRHLMEIFTSSMTHSQLYSAPCPSSLTSHPDLGAYSTSFDVYLGLLMWPSHNCVNLKSWSSLIPEHMFPNAKSKLGTKRSKSPKSETWIPSCGPKLNT